MTRAVTPGQLRLSPAMHRVASGPPPQSPGPRVQSSVEATGIPGDTIPSSFPAGWPLL